MCSSLFYTILKDGDIISIKKDESFYEAINTNEDGTVKKKKNVIINEDGTVSKTPRKKKGEGKKKPSYKTLTDEDKEYRDKINEFMIKHVFYDDRYAGRVPSLFYDRVNGALKEYRYAQGSLGNKKDIYTFKQFYIACALSVSKIDYVMSTVQFENTAHIINYIIKIIRNQLVEVGDMKVFEEIKEETSKKLDELLDSDIGKVYNPECNYIRKTTEEDEYLEEFI